MDMRYAILGILLTFAGAIVQGQSGIATQTDTDPAHRSLYRGRPVDHPEALSGVWETPDGHGGAVGIHLRLMTTVPLHVNPPIWTPQSWAHLQVSVFERRGSEFVSGDENYFSDPPDDRPVALERGRLRVHFVSKSVKLPSIDLDLVRQPDDCWHGRLHRGDFDSVVSLCRPASGVANTGSSLVGTWAEDNKGVLGCMHIFPNGEGGFTGWSDILQVPGRISFNPKGPGPQTLLQQYGSLLNIQLRRDGFVGIELHAFDDFYPIQHLVGFLTNDGSKLAVGFVSKENLPDFRETWTKVSGDACVDQSQVTMPR
jgi:hypothetical protein